MDFLIRNAEIFDPLTVKFSRKNIALVNGKIARPDEGKTYRQVIDASGCIVMPGLIDYHVHYFLHGSENSVNPDASSFCNGITTAVDGGTCGAGTYEMFRRSVCAMSEVRILNCLLAASGGQSNNQYPENLDPKFFDEAKILELFAKYPDNLVALKTRISHGIISPELAKVSLAETVRIAGKAETRVVMHVTDCAMPLDELAEMPGREMLSVTYITGAGKIHVLTKTAESWPDSGKPEKKEYSLTRPTAGAIST